MRYYYLRCFAVISIAGGIKLGTEGKSYRNRLRVLLGIFAVVVLLLVARFAYIQFYQGDELQKKAYAQQASRSTISPKRGTILDRNGKELAISVNVGTITCSPTYMEKNKKPVEEIALELSEILEMDAQVILGLFKRDSQYAVIKKKVEYAVEEKVREWLSEEKITGIRIEEDTKRYYPDGSLASHLIGFTGAENKGLQGVESTFEKYLKGVPGKILSEVDALQRAVPMQSEKRIDAQDGLNVVLTIDETIQYLTAEILDQAIKDYDVKQGGVAIVMDPSNGDILAMVSKPDFDLNDPFALPTGLESEIADKWQGSTDEEVEILNQTVWRNKAISDTYEPGSPFKSFTAAAGLEEGIVTPDTETNDAPAEIGGWTINCWRESWRLHGTETFREAVYNSCNPVFVRVAQNLGVSRFYKYLRAFGFYEKTGISLYGEGEPQFQTKPQEIDMATASFGQRFTITPIQLITGYTALINDGKLMKPRLVKELTDEKGNIVKRFEPEVVRTVISAKTSAMMRDILEGVVAAPNATGGNAYVKGYRVAGKTGTSQTTVEDVVIASFMGFAPANDPQISVLLALFDPKSDPHGGGAIAAPTVGKIMEEVLSYMQVEKRYTEKDISMLSKIVSVPKLTGMTIEEAQKALKDVGLFSRIETSSEGGEKVLAHNPKIYAGVPDGSTIILYTYKPEKEVTAVMPDLTGKTLSEAISTLESNGLNIKTKGNGVVSKQSVEAGTDISLGSVIEVEFMVQENVQ